MTNLMMSILAIAINISVVAHWSKFLESLGDIEKGTAL